MEFYWRKNDKEIEKKFDDLKVNSNEEGDKVAKKKAGTSIYDCFKLFEEPEILGKDNAWYCPKCKDFVLAKKQMQIYKAPKILILCLKRFKRK
jgi:ubiquitin C-terminal hydrolase